MGSLLVRGQLPIAYHDVVWENAKDEDLVEASSR